MWYVVGTMWVTVRSSTYWLWAREETDAHFIAAGALVHKGYCGLVRWEGGLRRRGMKFQLECVLEGTRRSCGGRRGQYSVPVVDTWVTGVLVEHAGW